MPYKRKRNLILGAERQKSLVEKWHDIARRNESFRAIERKNFVHVYVPEMLKRLFRRKSLAR